MTSEQKKRVAIVDDHPLVRDALANLVAQDETLEVVLKLDGQAGTEEKIIASGTNLVILDLSLGSREGLDILRRLKAEKPEISVLVVSMHEESSFVQAALRAGASGYILKTNDTALIPQAVKVVLSGGTFVSAAFNADSILQDAENTRDTAENPGGLTHRETDVVRGVIEGLAAKEIADRLGISYRTVEVHRQNAMRKLGARNSAELTRKALELKLDR